MKWAKEDPDPAAQKRLQEELKLESLNMMVHLINNNTNSAGTEVNNKNNERLDRTFPEASVDNVKKRLLPLDNGMESDDFIEKLKKVKKNISRENISSKPSVGKLGGPLLDYLLL